MTGAGRIVASAWLLAAAPAPSPPAPASIAGCWDVHVSVPIPLVPDQTGRFELAADAGALTGHVELLGKRFTVEDGAISADAFRFRIAREGKVMEVRGAASPGGLRGTMHGRRGQLTWTATRCTD